MAIQALAGNLGAIMPTTTGSPVSPARGGEAFASSLGKLVEATEGASAQANEAVGRMLDGSGDVHEAMIALQRADMSFELTVQIRNKFVAAYQEIMRMPI